MKSGLRQSRKKTSRKLLIGLSIIFFLLVLVAAGIAAESSEADKGTVATNGSSNIEGPDDYNVQVQHNSTAAHITNNESDDLKSCVITINGGLFGGGYRHTTDLTADSTSKIAWGRFTSNTERFNYNKIAPESFKISKCNGDKRSSYFTS